MGLDQFAYAFKPAAEDKLQGDYINDFSRLPDGLARNRHEIAYWRKHPGLQGWMEKLWRKRNPEATAEFNCVFLRLYPEDIDELEITVLDNKLPYTTGFFFGQDLAEDKPLDLAFCKKAREVFKDGQAVYYYSWW